MRHAALILAALALAILALFVGDQPLAPRDVARALIAPDSAPPHAVIILRDLRLPRVLIALLVGAALGVTGAVVQGVMRNPLAEPGIMGINGGAALAVTAVLSLRPDLSGFAPLAAFAGALTTAALILTLARLSGGGSDRVILIGIACGALAGALSGYLSAFGDLPTIQRAMVWMSGSLQDSRWPEVWLLAIWLPPALACLWGLGMRIDILLLGPDLATGLGLRPRLTEALLLGLCALVCGLCVAATGPIGFVGLMAPHLARRLAGRRHLALIPASALVGGALLVSADLAGRSLFAPVQIPAGIVCALIGAPLFAALMWRRA